MANKFDGLKQAVHECRVSLSRAYVRQKKKERFKKLFSRRRQKNVKCRLTRIVFRKIPFRLFCAANVKASDKRRQRAFLLRTESFEEFASARLTPYIEASPFILSSTVYAIVPYFSVKI